MNKNSVSTRIQMLDKLASDPSFMRGNKILVFAAGKQEYTSEIEKSPVLSAGLASMVTASILDSISPERPEEKYGSFVYLMEKYPEQYKNFLKKKIVEPEQNPGGISGAQAATMVFNDFIKIRSLKSGFETPYMEAGLFKNALKEAMQSVSSLKSHLGSSSAVNTINEDYKKLENIKNKRITTVDAAGLMKELEKMEKQIDPYADFDEDRTKPTIIETPNIITY